MPFLRFHPQNGTFLELSPSDFQTAIQKPKRRPTASRSMRQDHAATARHPLASSRACGRYLTAAQIPSFTMPIPRACGRYSSERNFAFLPHSPSLARIGGALQEQSRKYRPCPRPCACGRYGVRKSSQTPSMALLLRVRADDSAKQEPVCHN